MAIHTVGKAMFRTWLCGFAALVLLASSQNAWALAGTIQVLIGTARITQQTGQDRPALRGDNLYEGDTVSASANSNVQIRMVDDAMVWVRPESRFKIERYRSNQHGAAKNEASLRLISGSMRQLTGAIGKSSPADYKLSTPNATIGIRGTEFDASYLSPQAAAQANTAPGTYNRVYVGTTVLEGPAGRVTLNKDEAGFMGLNAGDKPQVLPRIPAFMTAVANPAAPRADASAQQPKSLLISVRYGEGDADGSTSISSRDTNTEQRVQAVEGEPASIAMADGPGARAGQTGARAASQSQLELVVKVNGSNAVVQFFSQTRSASSSTNQANRVATTMSIPLGVWTEVSGRGPWSGSSTNTLSSAGARNDSSRVSIKVEDISR
jgi:hypothetical protein